MIVTSRERLHLAEEHVLAVSGLPLPTAETKPEDVPSTEAVRLFLQRAKKATLSFSLDEASRPGVVRLVELVEGYPLAIELAAAWVRVLPVASIVDEIASNLDFLESDSSNAEDRHRSIRAAFEHSWKLLSPKDQGCLRDWRCSGAGVPGRRRPRWRGRRFLPW